MSQPTVILTRADSQWVNLLWSRAREVSAAAEDCPHPKNHCPCTVIADVAKTSYMAAAREAVTRAECV